MKMLRTSNINVVRQCQAYFDFKLSSRLWCDRVKKFEVEYATWGQLCKLRHQCQIVVIVGVIIVTPVCLFIFFSFSVVNCTHVRMCLSIVFSMNKDVFKGIWYQTKSTLFLFDKRVAAISNHMFWLEVRL